MATSSNAFASAGGESGRFTANRVLAVARATPPDNEKKPLWRYVEILESTKGQGAKVKCRFCNHLFQGSYSRVKAHLLNISGFGVRVCRVMTADVLEQLQAEVDAADAAIDRAMPRGIPVPTGSLDDID
ncbi:unnamed protein product [Urochloa humidicola]